MKKIIICVLATSLFATAGAATCQISLPDLIGLYNSEDFMSIQVSDPVLSTLSDVQKIQLHIEGTYSSGEATYQVITEIPGEEPIVEEYQDSIGLDVSAGLNDIPEYMTIPNWCYTGSLLGGTSGSFDVSGSFTCFLIDDFTPPLLSWDDYTSDGLLDLDVSFSYILHGSMIAGIITDPELNITNAELIIEAVPEPATLSLLGLGGLALLRRRKQPQPQD